MRTVNQPRGRHGGVNRHKQLVSVGKAQNVVNGWRIEEPVARSELQVRRTVGIEPARQLSSCS